MGKLIGLELFNFKSYRGHHIVTLGDAYFTSIIGPNGSGKSNSMDAISFVLGIKSTHLRSSHLKDLVYRGRVMKAKINEDGSVAGPDANGHAEGYENGDGDESHRASRNDPKTAWVMAVYEDDAGDLRKWKRTITAQGASEYRINNQVVTAQQYNDALAAENILVKARNFLVFQGDVEAIAAQSPQDLTRLIEQISGSVDYKADYERLQAEEQEAAENQAYHLTRRRGINAEIKEYQEQKKEAENFQKKTEERDAAVVRHILWKLYHYQRVMDESSEQIHGHQDNLKEFRRKVERIEKTLEAARKEQAAVGREVGKIERSIKQKERSIEDQENSLVPLEEKVKQISSQIEQFQTRIQSVAEERDGYKASIQKAEKEIKIVEKTRQQFEKQWKDTLQQQGKELSDADRKEYNTLRAQARAKSAADQGNLDNLRRQLKSDEVTVTTIKGNLERTQARVAKLQSDLDTIRDRRDAKRESVRQTTTEIDAKKKEYNQVKSERIRMNNTVTELEEKIQSVASKLETAQAGMVQNDRETRMKEVVAQMRRLFVGVRGRVGDLCKPKQKKYDEAVITALGRDFDSVIVDNDKTAIQCVEFLKEQKHPPITFIPLDNIKVNATNSSVKGIPGARLTIDTIDFEPALERAMAYACGSSVVCDSLDIAKSICYQKRIQVKAVTLEGYVIHKAGLMTGGRLPENKGSKRRFAEEDIQNLQRMFENLKGELSKLPRPNVLAHQEKTLDDDLANLEQRLRIDRAELQAFEKNLSSKQKEAEEEKRQLRGWEEKYAEEAGKLKKTQQAVARFEEAIARIEDKIFASFCQKHGFENIRVYEAQQGSLEQEAAEKRKGFEVQLQKMKSTLAWEKSRHDATVARVQQMERQLASLQEDIQTYESEKESIEESLGQERDEVAALEESLEELRQEHANKSEKVAEAKAELQKWTKDIDARQKAINALETEVQTNKAAKFTLLRRCKLEQIQIPLEEGSLDDLPNDQLLNEDADAMDVDDDDGVNGASEDYGIIVDFDSLDDELKQASDASTEERLEANIAELNNELQTLNPNLRAIEHLESVETRLRATEQAFADARQAARRAKEAFDAVKAKRYELFNKAFSHIQDQISHVYKELTRTEAYPLGGQAYLDIEEDTETPYLSGIKYHAMPPLKRFRDMEHLSGGEKTMAALALLFAIHSYQPSPFFVLDEVDAALDGANVEKIKNYIREHAGPGMQFIVISLKMALFKDSESLVGVYRDQDLHSSAVLTLDLRNFHQ